MNGIVLIDKPPGLSSAEVVRRVKAIVKPSRVGHLGTLDPIATGVLPILIGEATKLAPFLEGGIKEYRGTIRLGIETDTLDREGVEVRRAEVPPLCAERLGEIAKSFVGSIEQTPPIYSAIKRGGVALYKLARKGEKVEPPPARIVTVLSLELAASEPSELRFTVECGTGTYVRSLARDISLALGTVGHVRELRRMRNGSFSADRAQGLEEAIAGLAAGSAQGVIGLCDALAEMPSVEVRESERARIRNGDGRALDALVPAGAGLFKVVCGGDLVAVARADSRITARLERVFDA